MNKLLLRMSFILIFISGCAKDKKDIFNDCKFYALNFNSDKQNYIACIRANDITDCEDRFRNLEMELLADPLMTHYDGTRAKLTSFTSYLINYLKKEEYEEFLAAAIFLEAKDYTSKKFFDDMLEVSLGLDSTNLIANYELAKLRYNEDYIGLSHFLIDRLNDYYPSNIEISRLKKAMEDQFGKNTYDKKMNYKEYLDLNPHYITQTSNSLSVI